MNREKRILIVSNRLPIHIAPDGEKIKVSQSIGGLATGMQPVHEKYQTLWIGWSGIDPEDFTDKQVVFIKEAFGEHQCQPVHLDPVLVRDYYEGFSNSTVWPLFHYFVQFTEYEPSHWQAYQEVNRKFALVIKEHYRPGDLIWIHDYHLMLLPQMVRELIPEVEIGYFLHIPFPSFEIFRLLPWRKEIIEGLLGADLLGFHTFDYERHFLSSVRRLLGYEIHLNRIETGARTVKVDVFPLGIDYERYNMKSEELSRIPDHMGSEIQTQIQHYFTKSPDRKLILSIDRLDYTKGIPNRLHAFEVFLDKYPEYLSKVSMLMIATPTRDQVEHYQLIKKTVDELVGRINGKFSQIDWTPVWYFYRSFTPDQLIELYRTCQVALITPVRDGMNLVAKEYIASRVDGSGVLILSEMAGAARELSEALQINPNDPEETADAIKTALMMPLEEQEERVGLMQKRLKRYTVKKWAVEFIEAVQKAHELKKGARAKALEDSMARRVLKQYRQRESATIFLDYDGTLVGFRKNPEHAAPDPELLDLLTSLTKKESTRLVLISGRDGNTLEKWFGRYPVYLIAEHGAWLKAPAENWVQMEPISVEWKETIMPTMEFYADRTPGAFVEEKNYSLAWHYRKADPELGMMRAIELKYELTSLAGNNNLEILEGSKVIEIKNSGVNKGRAANWFLARYPADFIMAIGDDWTDEYMFKLLPKKITSIKVGSVPTRAKFYLPDPAGVRRFLARFVS